MEGAGIEADGEDDDAERPRSELARGRCPRASATLPSIRRPEFLEVLGARPFKVGKAGPCSPIAEPIRGLTDG